MNKNTNLKLILNEAKRNLMYYKHIGKFLTSYLLNFKRPTFVPPVHIAEL